jgi:hypothetical protein
MNTGYTALAKVAGAAILNVYKDWRKSRQMKMELNSITRAKLAEWEVERLNADLAEYHRTGKAPYDSTIAKHIQGRNPTTRIELKPKPETLAKASRERTT